MSLKLNECFFFKKKKNWVWKRVVSDGELGRSVLETGTLEEGMLETGEEDGSRSLYLDPISNRDEKVLSIHSPVSSTLNMIISNESSTPDQLTLENNIIHAQ